MRINIGAKFSLLITLLGLARAESATLYVSTQGSDSYPGTSAQPFRTITHAYGLAGPGTTILVAPGTYTDYSSGWGIHLGASGTASSPIVLRSQTPGAAVIDGLNASDRNEGLFIDGSYNIVDGFEIKNGPSGGISMWGNNNQILNCIIHNNGNPVTSSTQGQDGVYEAENCSGNIYAGNYDHHNGRTGNRLDHGFYLCGKNQLVINNVVVANGGSGIQVAGYTTVSNLKIYNNVLAYNGTQGIILWQTLSGVDIKNNILYANTTFGINTSDAHGSGVNIDHNLFYANPSGAFNMANNGSDVSYTMGSAINSDPGLVNETLGSFDAHINAGSPSIQSGLNLSSTFTTDMAGATRPSSGAWDLGAYKYNSSSASSGTADTTAPLAYLSAPANGATVSGTVTVTCNASDNVGVSSVQFQCDGSNMGSALTTAPYSVALNTANLANGSHSLTAIARDAAGNQKTTAAVTVNVANTSSASTGSTAVSVAATTPTAVLGTTQYGAFTFTRTGSTASALTVNYSLGGTAVKWNDYYRYGVGDMPVSITIPAGSASYTMYIVARNNQTHANPETVIVNLSASSSYQVGSPAGATMTIVSNAPSTPAGSADTTAPTASITSPANGATVSGTATVACNASDNVGVTSVQFQCDGANVGSALTAAPYSTALNTASLANGSHTLTAIVRDAAGNQTTTTAVTVNVANASSGSAGSTGSTTSPTVSVAATTPTAVLGTTKYGAFTFTRTGSTASALTVNYSLGGTAVKWNDYYRYGVGDMPVSITIPAGSASYTMSIVARDNQTHSNPETVIINLSASSSYQVGSPASATMTIVPQ
jgi:hypothetical protein